MSDELEISENTITALANFAERFIGYCYSGFLPLLVVMIEKPDLLKKLIDASGGLLTALICIVIGIGIYTFYYRVLGNFFIFPFQHLIHYFIDLLMKKTPSNRSCTIALLVGYGVPKKYARTAYHIVREKLFLERDQIEIQISHGELHVLYITSVVTLCSYFLLKMNSLSPSSMYLYASSLCFISAIVGDTHQHATEAALIRGKHLDAKLILNNVGLL